MEKEWKERGTTFFFFFFYLSAKVQIYTGQLYTGLKMQNSLRSGDIEITKKEIYFFF